MAILPPEQAAGITIQQESPVPMPAAMPVPMPAPATPVVAPQQNVDTLPLDQGIPLYVPPQPAAQPQIAQPQIDLSGFNKITKAGERAMQMGMKAAQEENALAEGYMQENEKFMKEQDDILQAKTQAIQEKQLEIQNSLDKVASQEIDSNRVFSSMGTGQKIGTFIMAALAGSRGAETLNRMIDNDIKAQTENKNSKIEALKGQKSLYNELLAQHKDVFATKSALKAMQYQALQVKLNALGSQTKNADFQLKLAGLNNEIEANKQKAINDFVERTQKLQTTNINANTTLDQITNKDDRERFVPGLGLAAGKEDATKLKEQGATTYAALGNIKALKSYMDKPFKSLNPSQRAEIQSEIGTLVGAMRVPIVGPGAFTDSERNFVKDLIGDPSQIMTLDSTTKAKLAKLEQILLRSRNATAKAYGLNPAPLAQDLLNKERVK